MDMGDYIPNLNFRAAVPNRLYAYKEYIYILYHTSYFIFYFNVGNKLMINGSHKS